MWQGDEGNLVRVNTKYSVVARRTDLKYPGLNLDMSLALHLQQ